MNNGDIFFLGEAQFIRLGSNLINVGHIERFEFDVEGFHGAEMQISKGVKVHFHASSSDFTNSIYFKFDSPEAKAICNRFGYGFKEKEDGGN